MGYQSIDSCGCMRRVCSPFPGWNSLLAQAYGWNYACIETEEVFNRALADLLAQNGDNTLLEVRLDPEAVPITASEHF